MNFVLIMVLKWKIMMLIKLNLTMQSLQVSRILKLKKIKIQELLLKFQILIKKIKFYNQIKVLQLI